MDIFVAAVLGLLNALFGIAGMSEFGNRLGKRTRVGILVTFLVLTEGLIVWQASLAHQSGEENKKTQLGDSERPPFISVISLPNATHFVTVNDSDYPAYEPEMLLYDDTHKTQPLRNYAWPEIPAHAARVDDKLWTPEDDASEHRFTAQITTRTGLYLEELILRRAGNDQWMRACRVRQGMRTLEQDVDSAWPRDKSGQVKWN